MVSAMENTSWKPMETSETLNFKMTLDAAALKNLCLWCKFQSCLVSAYYLKTFASPGPPPLQGMDEV